MSTVPNNVPPTHEEEEEGITPVTPVVEPERAKLKQSTSAPTAPNTREQPTRAYHGLHSPEGPLPYSTYHATDQLPANAPSGRQQPYRVVTSYLYYPEDAPHEVGGRAFPPGPSYSERVHAEVSGVRGIPHGPPYPASPPPRPTSLSRDPYAAQPPYSAPVRSNYSGGDHYGDSRGGYTHFERGAPIPPGQYTRREREILGNLPRECIARLFVDFGYKRWKTPEQFEQFMPPPPPEHYQPHQPHRYLSHEQQPHVAPPQHVQAHGNSYHAVPPGYPQRLRRASNIQRPRVAEDDRMTASELSRRQAQRPEVPEPEKQPPLRRLFGSKRRNERRVKDEEARRHNYYY